MSRYEADIIVVGAGPAGVCCALSACRSGAGVLLLERAPMVGGVPAGARVHSTLTFHGRYGQRIIGGIAGEIIDHMKAAGGSPGHLRDTVGVAHSVTPVDPDILPLVLQDMLHREGVHLLLEASYLGCTMDGPRIKSIHGVHPGGSFTAEGRVFVDCTGSGRLSADAGASFRQGRDGVVMPATLMFEVEPVDMDQVMDYALSHRDQFHHETLFDHLKKSPAPGFSGFFDLWRDARLPVPRDRLLFYSSVIPGRVGINSTRITPFDPEDPLSVTKAYREGRRQVQAITRFLREKIPGFSCCHLASVAPFLGVREVRRVEGEYVLTAGDTAMGTVFEDRVALGGFPVDIHSPQGSGIESAPLGGRGYYGIPYRCLIPKGIDNLLMAGKCFSGDFTAHASARVQATSMAMGQGAGVASAICIQEKKPPREIDISKIQDEILRQGGLLDPAEEGDLP